MIKYFCDITGKEMEKNDYTKGQQNWEVEFPNGNQVHMRAYFCVNNEGSGELSMDGIMLFMKSITDEYFGETYLDDLDSENDKIDLDSYCNDCDDLSVNGVNCRVCSKQ